MPYYNILPPKLASPTENRQQVSETKINQT